MAWSIATNLSRQRWARETIIEAEEKSFFFSHNFISESDDAIIKHRTELQKESGDRITYDFLPSLAGGGLTENDRKHTDGLAAYYNGTGLATNSSSGADAKGTTANGPGDVAGNTWGATAAFNVDDGSGSTVKGYGKLIGREEDQNYYSDQVTIMEKAQGIRKPGKWLDQIVQDKFRSDAKTQLAVWYAELVDLACFMHLAGNTSWLFPAAALAPTTSTVTEQTRQLWGGAATAKSELQFGDSFGVLELDRLKELAQVSLPRILPYKVDSGAEFYIVLVHPYQMNALRQDRDWLNGMYHAHDRGMDNPIFRGSEGIWNGMVIYSHRFVPLFTDGGGGSLQYARAMLLGQTAGCFATGWEPTWLEDTTSSEADYGRRPGLAIDTACGFKKTQFTYDGTNQVDYGVVAMDTWADKLQGAIQA